MPKTSVSTKTVREVTEVIGGVDTHADTHTVAALDQVGGLLGTATYPATAAGYQQLLTWLSAFGSVTQVGVEGTGSYGSGLARHLTAAGVAVAEVNRPNRANRRGRGKSDTIDAENAARAVLAGTATATPKARDGIVEAIRQVHTVRRGAVKARTAALNQFHALVVTAPDLLRATLQPLPAAAQILVAAGYRPGPISDPANATKTALRRLARRLQHLQTEVDEAAAELDQLTQLAAPQLRQETGVGPDTAAQVLVTAGDNPDRLRSEASFAALCGVSPVPASSGKTTRHRLSRGGDRQANRALYVIVLTRMAHDQPTRDYAARARAAGKTSKEIIRQLKRYTARRLYKLLMQTEVEIPALAA